MADFKIEHNVQTNEITEIPLTAKEIKEAKEATDIALEIEKAAAEAKAKAEADKAALLARLGLTDNEAKLLLS